MLNISSSPRRRHNYPSKCQKRPIPAYGESSATRLHSLWSVCRVQQFTNRTATYRPVTFITAVFCSYSKTLPTALLPVHSEQNNNRCYIPRTQCPWPIFRRCTKFHLSPTVSNAILQQSNGVHKTTVPYELFQTNSGNWHFVLSNGTVFDG